MSAFGQLWKRAPLWRLSLLIGIGGLGMAAFFPTQPLKTALPWLPGSAAPLVSSETAQTGRAGSDDSPMGGAHVDYPDLRETMQTSLPVASSILPLPEGEWHPVLAAQTDAPTNLTYLALVRRTKGIVNGLIILQMSRAPMPLVLADNLLSSCHDDRNFEAQVQDTRQSLQCNFLAQVALDQKVVSFNPLITETINRLHALNIPLPPLMVLDSWRRLTPVSNSKSGSKKGGSERDTGEVTEAQIVAVDVFLAPVTSNGQHLLAPPEAWTKEDIGRFPAARSFLTALTFWNKQWIGELNQGFRNPPLIPALTPRDPAFHAP